MTDQTTIDVGAMHEEFDMLRAQIITLQEQLAEKDKRIAELGWADSELHREGGAFCQGCLKRGLWIAALIGGYAVLAFLALTSCATPAQAATPNMEALWAAMPDTGVEFPAHHLGRHHCDGELIFTSKAFEFHCSDNAKKNFTVEREAVDKADDNGIKLLSDAKYHGAKYHFNIAGFTKDGTHALFNRWIETTTAEALQLRDEQKAIVKSAQTVTEDGWHTFTSAKPAPVVAEAPAMATPVAAPAPPPTPQPAKAPDATTPANTAALAASVAPTPHTDPPPAESSPLGEKLAAALGLFLLFPVAFVGIWGFKYWKDRRP